MEKIMETLDNIGIKLIVLAALKEHSWEYLSLFFCLFALGSASVNEFKIVFSNSSYGSTSKWESLQIFEDFRSFVGV
jgi:hypothetical protein